MSAKFDISFLEKRQSVPQLQEIPPTRWLRDVLYSDKYADAFRVASHEEADAYLLDLVAHSLRFGYAHAVDGQMVRMTWQEAFAFERDQLAWRAFFLDGKDGYFVGVTDPTGEKLISRTENTAMREFALRYYNATMPASVGINYGTEIAKHVQPKRSTIFGHAKPQTAKSSNQKTKQVSLF